MKLRALLIIMSLAISLIPVAMITGLQNTPIAAAFLVLILVVTFAASYVISYFIIRPLGKLTRTIDQISKGDLDVQLERSEIQEINTLTESLDRVMASLKLAIHKVGVKKGEIFEQAEKARTDAELKYQRLLRTVDGWVWEISADGRCIACTEKVAAALGQPAANIIGKDMDVFFGAAQALTVRKQLQERHAANQDEPFDLDHQVRHPDGHFIHVQTHLTPLKDAQGKITGFSCYSRDMTEQQTALDEIEGLQEKLKALSADVHSLFNVAMPPEAPAPGTLPTGTDYLVLFSDDMRVVDCSQGLSHRLGFPRDEVLSQGPGEIFSFPEYVSARDALEAARQKRSLPVTLRHRTKDGRIVQTSGVLEYIKDKNLFQYRPDLD